MARAWLVRIFIASRWKYLGGILFNGFVFDGTLLWGRRGGETITRSRSYARSAWTIFWGGGFSFWLELGSIASFGVGFLFLTFLIASFGWDETIDTPLFYLFIK
jgi:hypothetical protein